MMLEMLQRLLVLLLNANIRESFKYCLGDFSVKGVPPQPLQAFFCLKNLAVLGETPPPSFTDVRQSYPGKFCPRRLKMVFLHKIRSKRDQTELKMDPKGLKQIQMG